MFPNYETPEEKKQRRAEENANIQRVDAQTKHIGGSNARERQKLQRLEQLRDVELQVVVRQ